MDGETKDMLTAFFPVLIAGLSLWFNYRMDRRRSNIEEQKLELEREKILTSETYKSLFNQKIDLYRKINSLAIGYEKELEQLSYQVFDKINGYDVFYTYSNDRKLHGFMNNVIDVVGNNEFYMSDNIGEHYNNIFNQYMEIRRKYAIIWEEEMGGDPQEDEDLRGKQCQEFATICENDIQRFIKQVKLELNRVREKLAF
jgi:hypothetical protein